MKPHIQTQATKLLQQRAGAVAASALGETENAVSQAMELAVRRILEGMQQSSSESRSQLLQSYKSISGADYKQGIETLYGGTDAASHSDWSSRTGTVLDQLFGSSLHGVLCHIEEKSGVKQSSATTILGAAVPVVFGMVNEQDAEHILSQHSEMLSDQAAEVRSDEPIQDTIINEVNRINTAELEEARNFATDPLGTIAAANILPDSGVDNTRVVSGHAAEAPQSFYDATDTELIDSPLVSNPESAGKSNWLLYLLLAAILGLAIWWFTKG